MKYKLNEQDYRNLWLVSTPSEIAEEFGDRAHHPAHIYKVYQKVEASKVYREQKKLRKKFVEGKPDFISKDEAEKMFLEEMEDYRTEMFERMWKIIRDYEERWSWKEV